MPDGTALSVVELGAHPGLGLCGKWLQALGLRVMRIDEGDPRPSGADAYLHAGKERVQADLDVPTDLAELQHRLGMADVFITSLSLDRLVALELDFHALGERRAITIGRISHLGEAGEYAALAGGELQALALSGLLNIVGEPDRHPLPLAGSQAGYAGGLSLLTGVMFALWASTTRPMAREVVTSSVRSGAYLDWKSQIYFEAEGRVLVRGSDRGPIVVRCADGFLGFYYRPSDWESVKRIVGGDELDAPEFATQPDRDAHREELRQAIERGLAGRSRAGVYAASQAAGVPVGSVLSLAEALEDEQYAARELWEPVEVPGSGLRRAPGVPWTVDGTRPRAAAPATADGAGR